MASQDNNGINTTSLAKNLSDITGLTDTSDNEISQTTEIILPQIIKLNSFKYKIKEDGTVIINNSRLPREYQEVEYIESSGTQYIDTAFVPNQDTRVILDFQMTNPEKGRRIFGTRNGQYNSSYCFYYQSAQYNYGFYVDYNTQAQEYFPVESGYNYDRHLIDFNKNTVYFDGNLYYRFQYNTFTGYMSAYVFNLNQPATTNYGILKLYSLKIYDNDSLARNFITCKSVTSVINAEGNSVPADTKGLYDLVEGKFYTNANTAANAVDFIAGPEV